MLKIFLFWSKMEASCTKSHPLERSQLQDVEGMGSM